MDKNRSCFHCKIFAVCWLRLEIDTVLTMGSLKVVNLEGETPGSYVDIFKALGNACKIFDAK